MATDSLRDADEIRELKYAYCWRFDNGDLDGLLALFTEDAICDLGEFGSWRGRAELEAGYRNQIALSRVPGGRMHSASNPIIKVDGDDAKGWWYLVDYDIEPDTVAPLRIIAKYEDDYRRVEGTWLLAHTRLNITWRAKDGK